MSKAKRLEFLIITLVAGLSGALLYTFIALVFRYTGTDTSDLISTAPLLGGYAFFSITSGLLFTARWLSRRSLAVKVLLAFFWIVPLYFVMLSLVYSVPYGIYNLVLFFIARSQERQTPASEAAPSPAEGPGGGETGQPVYSAPGQAATYGLEQPPAGPAPQPIYSRPRQPAARVPDQTAAATTGQPVNLEPGQTAGNEPDPASAGPAAQSTSHEAGQAAPHDPGQPPADPSGQPADVELGQPTSSEPDQPPQ